MRRELMDKILEVISEYSGATLSNAPYDLYNHEDNEDPELIGTIGDIQIIIEWDLYTLFITNISDSELAYLKKGGE